MHHKIHSIICERKVSRYLRCSYEPDPFFSVDFCGSNFSTMLAPGLSNSYKVKFVPERNQDYHYQLKFASDGGDFVVPVVGEISEIINIFFFQLLFYLKMELRVEINSRPLGACKINDNLSNFSLHSLSLDMILLSNNRIINDSLMMTLFRND